MPGHKGGQGADAGLLEALGERALALDIPALTYGIDLGPEPTPFDEAQTLAAEAWGARRAWFLVNGASQGNLAAGLALAHRGEEVIVQRNAHSSTIDALVLSGLRPTFAAPELDAELGIAHCLTPETLDGALAATPDAVGAWIVSPTYFGAVADVRALAEVAHEHGVAADRGRGLGRAPRLPRGAARARARGRRRPRDLEHPQDRRQPHPVGDAAPRPRRADRRAGGRPGGHADRVDEPQLAAVRLARRRPPPGRRRTGASCSSTRSAALAEARAQIREIEGLDVLDERLVGRPGVFAYDPLRLAVDVRGVAASGYELAPLLREIDDINLELYGQNVLVAVFGMGERALAEAGRLVARPAAGRRAGRASSPRGEQPSFAARAALGRARDDARARPILGAQEVVAAERGRRAHRGRVAGDLPAGDPQRAARASA